jgi:membrane-associated phospholipid phosphatase
LKNKIARLISTIFVPPSFTLILFSSFAFLLEVDFLNKLILFFTSFIFGFILHIIFFFHLRRKGLISDEDASIKEERTYPYIVASLIYLTGFLILLFFDINIISTAFWFCYISNTILVMLINNTWKISAHTMGASGPAAALYFIIGFNIIFLIPLIGLIGWSRIQLKLHDVQQVIAGAVVGFASTFLQMYLIIYSF